MYLPHWSSYGEQRQIPDGYTEGLPQKASARQKGPAKRLQAELVHRTRFATRREVRAVPFRLSPTC